MNLIKLFETQKTLDEKIVKEKGLAGQDLLPMKILALQVELGELANEWRGFKFWSENREPRTKIPVTAWGEPYKNPLLEEYVDCLHFILSIGLEIDLLGYLEAHNQSIHYLTHPASEACSISFSNLFISTANFADSNSEQDLKILLIEFLEFGRILGFSWEQIETAYYAKNAINHKRQAKGY